MPNVELLHPIHLGEVDQELFDTVAANLGDGEQRFRFTDPNANWRNGDVDSIFTDVCKKLHIIMQQPETVEITPGPYCVRCRIVKPDESAYPLVGADIWHTDDEEPKEYDIIVSDSIPTEIVLGNVSLSQLVRLHPENISRFQEEEHEKIGYYLGLSTDEQLTELGLYFAQLLPYHAYLIQKNNYHRAAVNLGDRPIKRTIVKMNLQEVYTSLPE